MLLIDYSRLWIWSKNLQKNQIELSQDKIGDIKEISKCFLLDYGTCTVLEFKLENWSGKFTAMKLGESGSGENHFNSFVTKHLSYTKKEK
jgi:hypothetical protein